MTRSHKPIIWSLFAAGGTLSAFITPVMIVVTGLALFFGLLPAEALGYERMIGIVQHPIGKVLIFGAVFLPAWHAAHRLRITAHDFGLRADTAVAVICYSGAAAVTLAAIYALLSV